MIRRSAAYCMVSALIVTVVAPQANAALQTFGSVKDASMFANGSDLDNTAGGNSVIYVGTNSSGSTRRSLVQFDLSAIPSGSIINSVSLNLRLNGWSGSTFGSDRTIDLSRVTSTWGNGLTASSATAHTGGGGQGTNSVADGDVSWQFRSWSASNPSPPHQAWLTPGGDIAPGLPSASQIISNGNSTADLPFSWSGSGLVNDVQSWIDGTNANNGWLLSNASASSGTLLQFYSREMNDLGTTVGVDESTFQPSLTIDFTPIPEPTAFCLTTMALVGMGVAARRRKSSR
jgi:hypothetical protein